MAREGGNPDIKNHGFKKGQSGNPAGRPIGAKGTDTLAREAILAFAPKGHLEKLGIDPKTKFDPRLALLGKLSQNMYEAPTESDSNTAAKEIYDRMDGKSIARIEQTNEDVTPRDLTNLTEKELKQMDRIEGKLDQE